MDGRVIGLAVGGTKVNEVQQSIYKAEEYGIQAAWMTTGGARLDSMTMFAAAAGGTKNLKLGTSVVPIFPRHPLVMVQQAQVVAQLAPGRFRLGVGPSHRPTMRAMGIQMPSPLENLREYLRILKGLLQDGEVDYQGTSYQVKDKLAERVNVPVMASALQRGSFELCGAEADGAISWVSPATYLRDVGLPAMKAGADQANRPVPPLIAHVPVCVHDDDSEVRAAFREQFSNYPTLPFYRRMLISAGYPEAADAAWSDKMIDGLIVQGSEDKVLNGLNTILDYGASELLVSPILAGQDRAGSLDRTLRLLGRVSIGNS
ncbi:MAG: LLM class flavin-dependent oxidoreductase [Chloroflexota bacterium]|nr:LLM class flavin-dependent oxidoreductase [Chloroflexota bacterium]